MREFLELSSFILLLTGILLSVWGTYWSTHLYHTYSFLQFQKAAFLLIYRSVSGQMELARKTVAIATKMGEANPDNRVKALAGLYLLFLGFVLQGIGTMCGLIIVFMHHEVATACAKAAG